MGAQKHVLKKKKKKILEITLFAYKKKISWKFSICSNWKPLQQQMWKEDFQTPSTRQKNALTLKSSNKIMQLMFTKSTWLKHSKIKAFTFSRFLFFVKFFVFMLMTFYDTNTQWFIFLLLYQCKIPIFSNISYLKTFPFVKGIIRQGKFSEDIAILHYCK